MQNAFDKYLTKHGYAKFDLKAVLFDMDGVLFDSMKWHSKSWYETITKFGMRCTPEEFYLYEGMVGRNTINHIIMREKGRGATPEEINTIYTEKTRLFNEYNDGSLISYAKEFTDKVIADGLECLVVTGSGQRALLDKLNDGYPNVFKADKMVTAYDVKHGKPHPEPYLMGLEKAGDLTPNQAIVIENAPRGVEAASAAGIFTIAVNTGPLDPQVLANSGADIVLPSMHDLFLNWEDYRKSFGF